MEVRRNVVLVTSWINLQTFIIMERYRPYTMDTVCFKSLNKNVKPFFLIQNQNSNSEFLNKCSKKKRVKKKSVTQIFLLLDKISSQMFHNIVKLNLVFTNGNSKFTINLQFFTIFYIVSPYPLPDCNQNLQVQFDPLNG